MSERKTTQRWKKTGIQHLVKHQSGRYYGRRNITRNKQEWKSLDTTVLEVAKVRLRRWLEEAEGEQAPPPTSRSGRMTMGEAMALLETEIAEGLALRKGRKRRNREASKSYRRQTVEALKKSWLAINGAELPAEEVRKVAKDQVEKWAKEYRAKVSPSRFNNTLGTLRHLFEIAAAKGETARNPATSIEREEVKPKSLTLPERETFPQFVAAIRAGGHRFSAHSADFVEFLAYTGARKTEGANVLWRDVNFHRGTIHIADGKGGYARDVPMIPEARALLERLREETPHAKQDEPVLAVTEARGSMDAAAEKIRMERITHHDLRHLFATVAIESGVDIPTVSRWLGHKDGGALALRTYGHLRDEHSQAAAKRVSFAPVQPENVTQFPAGKEGVA